MLTAAQLHTIDEECNRVLHQNWREGERRSDGVPFHYTCPSLGRYPWQWYWDSGFAAIAWRHFDPIHSELELRSLLAAQREDGFIGHTIFWNERLSDWHRFTYNITSADATMTASIQPPLLAWAWRIAVGDPGGEPDIVRHHAWLAEHRDLDGDGLLWIVQPDESGLDASTQFDAIWGHRAHGLAAFPLLVQRNRRMGYDLGRIAAAGGPVCCEVTTNVLYNLSRLAMGQPSLTEALITRTYDAGEGLFLPVARPHPRRRPATTVAALTPLALPDLPEEIGHRLVREHLLDPTRFWTAVPPPSVSLSDPGFSLRDTGGLHQRRYWRGPTWINTAWLCWLGLVRLGYEEQADQLAERVATAVATSGLREYYNPHTGAGMGARDFGWSSLVLEMTQSDREPARSSFLKCSS
jgi:hypothetical protein